MYYSELLNNIIYYVMVSESIIGISGNGLGIAILRKHNLAASSSKLLLALCANDLFICFFMCGTGIQKLFIYLEGKYSYVLMISVTNVLNLVSTLVFSVLVPISLILTTSISVERFIAVCFPFHVSRIMTSGRVSVYIILIYVCFGVVASPAFLRNSLLFEYSPLYNATVVVIRYSEYYLINRVYIDTYLVKVLGNTLVAVCLPVIFVSTVTITIKLVWRKMEHVSEQGTRKNSVNQYKVIKMLTTVCSLTFLTYLAGQSIYTVRSLFPDEIFSSLTGEIYLSAYRLVMHVNASANFIIYICMCKKFRIEFLAIVLYVPKHILRIIKLFHV
ncbi:trace amine-associated receptor 3 [Biomphalaria glabrata]|nr:trace amine-associated receptor 3 [Biomphalaria glabrata]